MQVILQDGTVRDSESVRVDNNVKELSKKISKLLNGSSLFEIESALNYYRIKYLNNSKVS